MIDSVYGGANIAAWLNKSHTQTQNATAVRLSQWPILIAFKGNNLLDLIGLDLAGPLELSPKCLY